MWSIRMRRIVCGSLSSGSVRHHASVLNTDGVVYGLEKSSKASGCPCGGSCVSLPAVSLAMRVIIPCLEFPAIRIGTGLHDHCDTCVLWREHFSFEHNRPYCHNHVTNATTFLVPAGFMTRFLLFHRRNVLFTDAGNRDYLRAATGGGGGSGKGEAGAPEGGSGSPASPEGGDPPLPMSAKFTAKQKLAAYGGGGLLLYLIVHNVLLASIFFSLYFLHIDLVGFARSYGFLIGGEKVGSDIVDEPDSVKNKKYPSFWATLGISILLNKLLVPLELTMTLVMAPIFVPRLQPFVAKFVPYMKTLMNKRKLGF